MISVEERVRRSQRLRRRPKLRTVLRTEVYHAAGRSHLDTFLTYLEGWWFRRAVTQLKSIEMKDRILSDELELQMSDLRD